MGIISCAFFLFALFALDMGKVGVSAACIKPSLLSRERAAAEDTTTYVSALGDPGMRSDRVRVAVEGWNFCNGANTGISNPPSNLSSPRWADCTDLYCPSVTSSAASPCLPMSVVTKADNLLVPGDAFPRSAGFTSYTDPDSYAIEKEKYLGALCAVNPDLNPWSFWMIMLKNGNFDLSSGLCPVYETNNSTQDNHQRARLFRLPYHTGKILQKANNGGFPCFGTGCMNQPLLFQSPSRPEVLVSDGSSVLKGGIYGTYDLNQPSAVISEDSSFFSVNWFKNESGGSWNFHHILRVSQNYPWLMLYLRADATSGMSGGYPWDGRGMMHQVPQSPNFRVEFTLNVQRGGGPASQFYLIDMGGCWKNNGEQCDGDHATDVTRYSEMIINPDTPAWCNPNNPNLCPPYHTTANGTKIHRTDTVNFPYTAYHYYCVPYNALYAEKPYGVCDPYSNPQGQELMQLLPHPEWAVNGFPASKGEGWIGDPRKWELDVGALSSRLFFYQDPGTTPAVRKWPSLDIGTEMYISDPTEIAEWTVSDFNVLVPPS